MLQKRAKGVTTPLEEAKIIILTASSNVVDSEEGIIGAIPIPSLKQTIKLAPPPALRLFASTTEAVFGKATNKEVEGGGSPAIAVIPGAFPARVTV